MDIQLTNVKNDPDNKLLAIVYIVSIFLLENLPKPLLTPYGVKGSAKSTFQEFIKLIVDPSALANLKYLIRHQLRLLKWSK